MRGNECRSDDRCITRIDCAARAIPKGARILGEWHTHPTVTGSRAPATETRASARRQRHIPLLPGSTTARRAAKFSRGMYAYSRTARARRHGDANHLGNLSDTPAVNEEEFLAWVSRRSPANPQATSMVSRRPDRSLDRQAQLAQGAPATVLQRISIESTGVRHGLQESRPTRIASHHQEAP